MALKANLAAVTEIQAHLRGYGGHPLWKNQSDMDSHLPPMLQAWECTVRDLRWDDPAAPHRFLDCTGMGPGSWRTASLREISHPLFCANLIRKLRRMLHGRQRLLLRREISAHTARLEALRAEGRIGKVIRSVLQEDSELYALETLSLPGQATLTDHKLIHNAVTAHFQQWYQGPPSPAPPWATLISDFSLFQDFGRSKHVPDDLLELLWRALTDVPQINQVRDDLAVELALPPSLTEFQAAIHGHRGSTSPGATGLTYNMAKGWPSEVTAFAHQCLLLLWDQAETPAWMQWGWLCPKPKDPEAEITLDGLRPLILLEVVRKLWVGIVVSRITRAWERHSVLASAQHGFRPGRGTDTALLQFMNATEHAVEAQLPLYTSSWDIRRAFDSVSREAMEVSWLRLGVPSAVARWLAYMDVGGPTVIRTPWALATWQRHHYDGFRSTPSLEHPATFVRTRGTPQGDVSSPHNWVSFFDIALRALELDQQDPGETPSPAFTAVGRRGQLYPTGDISYADDLVSTAGSLPGLQRKADILSAFTVLFDMELSPGKLRLAAFGPCPTAHGTPPELVIDGPQWAPTRVPLRTSGTIKMLGVTFDTSGPQRTQKAATKLRLARACTILCAQRRPDCAVIAASVSSLTRASYTAQFTPWAAHDISDLDVPLNQLFRRLSGNMRSYPTHLLYLPTSMGGLGLPRLSTYVNTRKWCIAQRALLHTGNTSLAVERLLDRAARLSGCRADPGQPTGISPTTAIPVWGSSFGAMGSGPPPVLLQKGTFTSTADLFLAPYVPTTHSRRHLHALQRCGHLTLGDLSHAPPDAPRS